VLRPPPSTGLADAGVPDDRVAQVERLIGTAVLAFVIGETSGRLRNHSRRHFDADFDALRVLLSGLIETEVANEASG
jgi:hypothetical protein